MFELTNSHNKQVILLVSLCNYILHVRPTGHYVLATSRGFNKFEHRGLNKD